MSDGALKCFSTLADRFIRRGIDPAPLARNGLMEELVDRLGGEFPAVAGSLEGKQAFHQRLSTTIGLLSTLCRGSDGFSRHLFRSSLPEALEKALQGDERWVAVVRMRMGMMSFIRFSMLFILLSINQTFFSNPPLHATLLPIQPSNSCRLLTPVIHSNAQKHPRDHEVS